MLLLIKEINTHTPTPSFLILCTYYVPLLLHTCMPLFGKVTRKILNLIYVKYTDSDRVHSVKPPPPPCVVGYCNV